MVNLELKNRYNCLLVAMLLAVNDKMVNTDSLKQSLSLFNIEITPTIDALIDYIITNYNSEQLKDLISTPRAIETKTEITNSPNNVDEVKTQPTVEDSANQAFDFDDF